MLRCIFLHLQAIAFTVTCFFIIRLYQRLAINFVFVEKKTIVDIVYVRRTSLIWKFRDYLLLIKQVLLARHNSLLDK